MSHWRPFSLGVLLALTAACQPDLGETQRGRYYWGHEVNVLCPCELDLCYWVRADPTVLDPLKNFVQRQTDRPYQPVFLTFQGHMLTEPAVGFGASYDGHQQIDQVLSVSLDMPADCQEP